MRLVAALILLAACKTPETFETVKVMVGDVICTERITTSKLGTGSAGIGVDAGVLSGSIDFGVGLEGLLAPFNDEPEAYTQERRCEEILDEAKAQAKMQTRLMEQAVERGNARNLAYPANEPTIGSELLKNIKDMSNSSQRWSVSEDF